MGGTPSFNAKALQQALFCLPGPTVPLRGCRPQGSRQPLGSVWLFRGRDVVGVDHRRVFRLGAQRIVVNSSERDADSHMVRPVDHHRRDLVVRYPQTAQIPIDVAPLFLCGGADINTGGQ